jgi:hypothetical protein
LDEEPGLDSFSIRPIAEDGIGVGDSVLVFEEGSGSQNILEGPGTFTLEIESEGFEYTVTVEDCSGANGEVTNGEVTNGELTNDLIEQEVTVEDDEDLREEVIIERPERREPTVINIPNKPLPPTGGLPVYGIVAGCILAGTGLLGLGIGIRRGERR